MSKTQKDNALRYVLAVTISAVVSVAITALGIYCFRDYGLVLFVFLPILTGILSTVIYSPNNEKTFGKSVEVSFVTTLLIAIVILLFAFEGLICLIMASPLALMLNLVGVVVGKAITALIKDLRTKNFVSAILILIVPFLFGFETSIKSEPNVHKVVSTVEINAPIEKVWETVVAFPQIEKEPEGILKLGFAYPVNAKIDGSGVGAVRYCNFNTGAFVEPITVWQKPNLLAFDVKEQPAPMIEKSFYDEIHPAHLDYIKSQRGQFRLYEKDGKTVVEGTTFYTHEIAPDFYWKLFSDEIIHQIHLRVLNHIKEVAENN